MSEVKRFEYTWAGRPLIVEIGEVAKQANGACMVTYGEVRSYPQFVPIM